MNTIALIEDNSEDFDSVKKIFSDTSKQIWPDYPDYYEFWQSVPRDSKEHTVQMICEQIESKIDTLSAIIMDIALYEEDDNDDCGIQVIKRIREKREFKYKLIPIFCYSRFTDAIHKKDAFAAGATNVFKKELVDNHGIGADGDIAYLKISVDSQMLAYQLAQYSITSLERVEDYLEENAIKTNFLVEGLMSLMKLDKINEIADDTEKKQMLGSICGGEDKLEEVKRKLYQKEKNNKLADDLDGIADLLPPGLNRIPKLLSMFLKNFG